MGIGGLGMAEMVLIFLVVLLLFGAKRLPEIGSALGKGIREFKGSVREIENELRAPDEDKKKTSAPPARGGEPRRLSQGAAPGSVPDDGTLQDPKEKDEATVPTHSDSDSDSDSEEDSKNP